MAWLAAGGVLAVLILLSRFTPGTTQTGTSASPTALPIVHDVSRVSAALPVGAVPTTGGAAALLTYGQKIAGYVKQGYDLWKYVGITPVDSGVGATTLPGGALTVSAPDILLPVGENVAVDAATATVEETGLGLVSGGELGVDIASTGTEAVAGEISGAAAGLIAGVAFIAADVIKELVNLGFNAYVPGSISKEIMKRRQIAALAAGNDAAMSAIFAARNFPAAIAGLQHAGGSGQIQWGLGHEAAGLHLEGAPGSTETPGWRAIVQAMGRADVLQVHPEAVINFIANLWVKTGVSGATNYDAETTMRYRRLLLSTLPYTPLWNGLRQIILNADPVDPLNRDARDAAYDAVPSLSADGYVRCGWARIRTDHLYYYLDAAIGRRRAIVEDVAYNSATVNPHDTSSMLVGTLFGDTTANLPLARLGWYNEGTYTLVETEPRDTWGYAGGVFFDPAYLDPFATPTPILRRWSEARYTPVVPDYATRPALDVAY
jgi:hypothetical protein